MQSRTIRTDVLDVAYEEHGPSGGAVVLQKSAGSFDQIGRVYLS